MKATRVKEMDSPVGGQRCLYKLDPPLKDYDGEEAHEFVVASAVIVPFDGGAETYVFPADDTGEITDWGELPGSYKGGMDCDEAIRQAGYEIENGTDSTQDHSAALASDTE